MRLDAFRENFCLESGAVTPPRTIEQFIDIVDSYIRWHDEKRINASPGTASKVVQEFR